MEEESIKINKSGKKTTRAHRQFEGEVVGGPKDKTIKVLVKTIKTHPKYKKQFFSFKKYAVHDEKMEAKAGDRVVFAECRPISKTKHCRLTRVIKKVV